MSASAALCEISLPQLAPIDWTLISLCGTPEALLSAASTLRCAYWAQRARLHAPLGRLTDRRDLLDDRVAAAAG